MTTRSIQSQVEQEYGRPFWDVVRDYATDGESMSATGRILGYSCGQTLVRMIHNKGVAHWFRPGIETNGFVNRRNEMTPAKLEQIRRLQDRHKFEFNGVVDTREGHARRLGLSPKTVTSRVYRGWSVQKALTVRSPSRRLT